MPERTLEDRYRLLAAAFRESDASAQARARLRPGFQDALDVVVGALWRDVIAAPRDLDREKVSSLLATILPARLVGNEPWIAGVPDLLDDFLGFIAREESIASDWEWKSAIAESRDAFRAAVANPGRERLGDVKFKPDRRPGEKLGRNDPCFCGSGRKYKHCCLKLLP